MDRGDHTSISTTTYNGLSTIQNITLKSNFWSTNLSCPSHTTEYIYWYKHIILVVEVDWTKFPTRFCPPRSQDWLYLVGSNFPTRFCSPEESRTIGLGSKFKESRMFGLGSKCPTRFVPRSPERFDLVVNFLPGFVPRGVQNDWTWIGSAATIILVVVATSLNSSLCVCTCSHNVFVNGLKKQVDTHSNSCRCKTLFLQLRRHWLLLYTENWCVT